MSTKRGCSPIRLPQATRWAGMSGSGSRGEIRGSGRIGRCFVAPCSIGIVGQSVNQAPSEPILPHSSRA